LPGAIPLAVVPGRSAEVKIRRAQVPEQLAERTATGPVWELGDGEFLLRLPELGRVLASDGQMLEVEPLESVAVEELVPFLMGTGWGALLGQRGLLTLHAAVVAREGRAIAICAARGTGKSTTAGAMCRAGAQLVCDDLAAVSVDEEGMPLMWPDGRCLKLYPNSIAHLGMEDERRGEVRVRVGKYYVEPRGDGVAQPVRLDAIYLLGRTARLEGLTVERLGTLDAAQRLLANSYRRRLTLAMAGRAESAHMVTTAAILRHAPVFRLRIGEGLPWLEETAEGLLHHWRGLQR
jgi:hypothetical protein